MDNADKFLKALLSAQFGEGARKTQEEEWQETMNQFGKQLMPVMNGLKNAGFTHDEAFQILLKILPVSINS